MCSTGRIFNEQSSSTILPIDECKSLGHYLTDKLRGEFAQDIMFTDSSSDKSWTGAQLYEDIMNIAHALADEFHLGVGTPVCIAFDNTAEAHIVAIACICAGAMVACSYPKDPYAELAYLARKIGLKVLFCREKNRVLWAKQLSDELGHQVTAISVDGDHELSLARLVSYNRSQSKSDIPCVSPDIATQVALITMSSGTTGKPKAVAVTHRNCLAEMNASVDLLGESFGRGLVYSCCASLDYVSGRVLIFNGINLGYRSIIINGFEAAKFAGYVEKYKVNVVYMGAASFYNLISLTNLDNYDLSSIEVIFPMGAKIMYLKELGEFMAKHPRIKKVIQGYGSSETAGVATCNSTPDEYLKDAERCGKLWPQVSAKIVEPETGRLLDRNEIGILYIKGPNLFPGYYDCELLSKQASPFYADSSIFDQHGFYITGDLAYFNSNDELYVIGRQKELMSCRGSKKVLPQELEEVLSEHPAASKVCVLGIPSTKSKNLLHCPRAFFEPKSKFIANPQLIDQACATRPRVATLNRDLDEEMELMRQAQKFQHQGNSSSKLSSLEPAWRHKLAEDLMQFMNERISWEKQPTGGIVILDTIPTSRETGKVDKNYLRSLTLDLVEIYGDQSTL